MKALILILSLAILPLAARQDNPHKQEDKGDTDYDLYDRIQEEADFSPYDFQADCEEESCAPEIL